MGTTPSRGLVYRCPVCGSELLVVARRMGRFEPHCCNVAMIRIKRRARFYYCPVCGAELSMLKPDAEHFHPRCCNVDMILEEAA